MKKEFIVARIEASQDGSPYVYVTFNDPKEYKPGEKQQNPFGPNAMAFSSLDDSYEEYAQGNVKYIWNYGWRWSN